MPREVTDKEGIVWNCVQAYAGLDGDMKNRPEDAERVEAAPAAAADAVEVVATPRGGAQAVRLELESNWEESASDQKTLDKIREKQ